jgi:hypothetical protein
MRVAISHGAKANITANPTPSPSAAATTIWSLGLPSTWRADCKGSDMITAPTTKA